ncbi:hypothetical protein L7F22_027318 [Adiantum nelumboides]|nr:hypothetical protein [Adiantum nelumboides]
MKHKASMLPKQRARASSTAKTIAHPREGLKIVKHRHEAMKLVFARNYLVQALKRSSHINLSCISSVGASLKASNYSTFCQPSLEVRAISTGEVCEESQMQQAGLVKEYVERSREQLKSKTQLVQNVQPHVRPDRGHTKRFTLKVVVQSCVKRWFKEHLRNAETGDSDAQILIGQMISHGYGVPKDKLKGEEWLKRVRSRQKQSKESSEKKKVDEELYFMSRRTNLSYRVEKVMLQKGNRYMMCSYSKLPLSMEHASQSFEDGADHNTSALTQYFEKMLPYLFAIEQNY